MERFVGKVAVVTGTSSGSGLETAKALLRHGVHVAGLARRIDNLEQLRDETENSPEYKGKFHPVQCDLTKPEEISSSMKWVFENLGPVYILVNNAGVFDRTSLLDASVDQIKGSFAVNTQAAIFCSQEVVKNMAEHKTEGHIININALCGIVMVNLKPPEIYMLYSSTKHALRVVSEGLRREVMERRLFIKVTDFVPAYVRTASSDGLDLGPGYEGKILEPTEVANSCITVLETPRNVLISQIVVMPNLLQF